MDGWTDEWTCEGLRFGAYFGRRRHIAGRVGSLWERDDAKEVEEDCRISERGARGPRAYCLVRLRDGV